MDKVTVIIPSYNHSKYVQECIESVYKQSHQNKEVIVIDDGSTDGSPELLKKLKTNYPFHLILKSNEGVCATLNRGISIASGDYITFIASDDFMPANRLAEQIEAFKTFPDADVIAGTVKVVDEHSHVISTKKPRCLGPVSLDQLYKKNMIFAPTAVFKKEVFTKYGTYNEKYLFEDYYLWLKILHFDGKIINADKVWAFYRIHSGDLERRFRWYFKGYNQILGDYKHDPRAIKAINHYVLVFCAKMTLLQGYKFFKTDKDELRKLHWGQRILLLGACLIPSSIRKRVLIYLLKEL